MTEGHSTHSPALAALKDYLNWTSGPEISFSLMAIVLFLLIRPKRQEARGPKGILIGVILALLAVVALATLPTQLVAICLLVAIPFFGGEKVLLGSMGLVTVIALGLGLAPAVTGTGPLLKSQVFFGVTLLGTMGVVMLPIHRAWTLGGLVVMMAGLTGFLMFASTDAHFGGPEMLLKADNVPIVIMLYLFGFFLWVSMYQAVINDRRAREKLPPVEKETSDQKTWTWPDLLYAEFISLIVFSILLIAWAVFIPAPLEDPANPSKTPNPSKAPWYFLGLQEMLVYYDPWYAGVVLPTIIIIGLCAIPYVDKNPKGMGYYTLRDRYFSISYFFFGFFALWIFMIITGTFLRGPGWNFFGFFEHWNLHKVVSSNNVNLSEIVWVKIPTSIYAMMPESWHPKFQWLLSGMPEVRSVTPQLLPPDLDPSSSTSVQVFLGEAWQALKREWSGVVLIAAYFLALPPLLAKKWMKPMYEQLGFARYNIVVFMILSMGTLPLKMILRWTINLKYFIDTPWIKF